MNKWQTAEPLTEESFTKEPLTAEDQWMLFFREHSTQQELLEEALRKQEEERQAKELERQAKEAALSELERLRALMKKSGMDPDAH